MKHVELKEKLTTPPKTEGKLMVSYQPHSSLIRRKERNRKTQWIITDIRILSLLLQPMLALGTLKSVVLASSNWLRARKTIIIINSLRRTGKKHKKILIIPSFHILQMLSIKIYMFERSIQS